MRDLCFNGNPFIKLKELRFYALCVGVLVLFLSIFIFERDKHVGFVYYGLVLVPLVFCFDKRVFFVLFNSRIFIVLATLLFYLAMSSIWSGSEETLSYFKKLIYIFCFLYSIVFLLATSEAFLNRLVLVAVFVIFCLLLFGAFEYFFL